VIGARLSSHDTSVATSHNESVTLAQYMLLYSIVCNILFYYEVPNYVYEMCSLIGNLSIKLWQQLRGQRLNTACN